MRAVNKNPDLDELRSFGWVMLCGLAVLGIVLWYASIKVPGGWWPQGGWVWKGGAKQTVAVMFWTLGPLLWVISRIAPTLARRVYVVWMTGATYMGTVTTFVLLSLLFLIALPVFSLIRFTDPLRLRLLKSGSYWEKPKPHEATLERMARPF